MYIAERLDLLRCSGFGANVLIFIDRRVGSAHLAEDLEANAVPCELTTLEYGDVAFVGNGPDDTQIHIGIELKNVNDLINSMQSGRLAAHQIPGLIERYAHTYLIIEGSFGPAMSPKHHGAQRPVAWRELEAFLVTLEVQAGIHIRHSRTANETAALIMLLYHWWTDKRYEEHRSLQALDVPRAPMMLIDREDEVTQRLRKVAACLPCIGWGRSKGVAARFRSIEALALASQSEWEEIEGVGRNIARDVWKAIREEIPTRPIPDAALPARRVSKRGGARA